GRAGPRGQSPGGPARPRATLRDSPETFAFPWQAPRWSAIPGTGQRGRRADRAPGRGRAGEGVAGRRSPRLPRGAPVGDEPAGGLGWEPSLEEVAGHSFSRASAGRTRGAFYQRPGASAEGVAAPVDVPSIDAVGGVGHERAVGQLQRPEVADAAAKSGGGVAR